MYLRPAFKLGSKYATLSIDNLKLRCSICFNPESPVSNACLIDQDEPLSPKLCRSNLRLSLYLRRFEISRSEAAGETSSQGQRER